VAEPRKGHVLIAGVTTRALAISAARAGYRVTAVDAFGDLDLRAVAEVITLRGNLDTRYRPHAAAAAGATVAAEMVAYTSNFENHPAAVARLGEGRRLLGNPPQVLARVRNPIELTRVLRRYDLAAPEVRATPAMAISGPSSWLLKPRRSGGGHGIKPWRAGCPVPRNSYLQERIAGIPGSIVFAADGYSAVPLGLSRQLVADARFGAHGFRYCGSMLATSAVRLFPHQEELLESAAAVAAAVTREFQLVGLNGIDFIARRGVAYPVEVNPRYSASMELVERAHGISMFQVHVGACSGVVLSPPATLVGVEGKAIVFARRDVTLRGTRAWLGNRWLADIPHRGERIRRGHPICTVFARAREVSACRRLLTKRAAAVYRAAESRKRQAA
jgi:predicted ATP-grasp superfamily ATP-dependent carboligase